MKTMKLIVGWPLSWLCFWVGDLLSWVLERWDENEYWAAFWYPLYNACMLDSNALQDWAGGMKHFPWKPSK